MKQLPITITPGLGARVTLAPSSATSMNCSWVRSAGREHRAVTRQPRESCSHASVSWLAGAWANFVRVSPEVNAEEDWRKATEDATAAREVVAKTKRQAKKKVRVGGSLHAFSEVHFHGQSVVDQNPGALLKRL